MVSQRGQIEVSKKWDWLLVLVVLVVGCLCIYTAIVFATK